MRDTTDSTHILLIGSDPDDARLFEAMLAGAGRFALTCAASLEAARTAMQNSPTDVILLDLAPPGGLDNLSRVRQVAPYVPIVALVGPDGSAAGEDALARGVQDYLVKGSFNGGLLMRSLRYALAISRAEAVQRRADEFLQKMLDVHSARIAIVDEQGTIVAVNEAWRALAAESGAAPETVNEGANYLAVCDSASGEEVDLARQVAAAIRSVLAGERDSFATAYTCACPDEEGWFSLRVTRFPSGGPRRAVILHEDITERVRAEQRLQRYADQLDALRQVTLDITARLDLDQLLEVLVGNALKLLGARMGGIYLYRPDRDVLEWTVSVGSGMAPLGSELKRGEGLSGRVWDSGDPLVVDNYAVWEGRAAIYGDPPWTAVVGVPITWGEEFLGVLDAVRSAPGTFSETDVLLLSLLADQAAVAIHNARLYESERQQRALAEALAASAAALNRTLDLDQVLDAILSSLERVVPHQSANIMLVENGVARVVRSQDYPGGAEALKSLRLPLAETPNLKRMAESGRALAIPDIAAYADWREFSITAWIKSEAGAPIMSDGKAIGFIFLDSATPGFFSDEHARHLQAFADQAAVAIRNARLYQELENYSSILEQAVEERTADLENVLKHMQAILYNSPDAILLLDANGTIELVNRAFSETFTYDSDEVTGKLPDFLAAEKSAAMLRDAITRVRAGQPSQRLEITARRKNGDLFDADVAIASIRQEEGVSGVVCSLRDITALKEVERIKDAFVSTAAHELRTPLTTIRGFAELLLVRQIDGERARRYLGMINDQAINLSRIIDDLLDLSRLEAGHAMALDLQPVDLPPLVEEAVRPFREPNPLHHFEIAVPRDLPQVRADPFRVAQVLNNLLSNAIKYSPQGGPIGVRAWRDGDAVGVAVQDSGIGVPPDLQPRVFERFYRVDVSNSAVGGTGLGLTICKQIVEMHGGRIWLESTPGAGSTFYFTLPVTPAISAA